MRCPRARLPETRHFCSRFRSVLVFRPTRSVSRVDRQASTRVPLRPRGSPQGYHRAIRGRSLPSPVRFSSPRFDPQVRFYGDSCEKFAVKRASTDRADENGAWQPEYAVITELVEAGATTILIADAAAGAVELRGAGSINLGGAGVAGLEADVGMVSAENMFQKTVASEAVTPLLGTTRLNRDLWEKLRDLFDAATGGGATADSGPVSSGPRRPHSRPSTIPSSTRCSTTNDPPRARSDTQRRDPSTARLGCISTCSRSGTDGGVPRPRADSRPFEGGAVRRHVRQAAQYSGGCRSVRVGPFRPRIRRPLAVRNPCHSLARGRGYNRSIRM